MTNRTSKYDIYLSYAQDDLAWVESFMKTLEAHGVQPWAFHSANGQGNREIKQALRKSKTLVMIVTPTSIDSPSVLFEFGAALAGEKRIIPVLVGNPDLTNISLLNKYHPLHASSPGEAGEQVAELLQQKAS